MADQRTELDVARVCMGIKVQHGNAAPATSTCHARDIGPGDRVITSGFLDPSGTLGSAYPRGLPIGVVSEARQSDANTYKSVLVVPWVELGSFANVVILTGAGGDS